MSLSRAGIRRGGFSRWLVFAAVAVWWNAAQAAAPTREIVVGIDDNYPPYVFRSDRKELQGILIDRWRLWEKKTGLKVRIEAMDWGLALRRMRAGGFDVIDTIFESPERAAFCDFSPPYARIEVPIFFRKEITGITDVDSLRGFPVAVKTGDHAIEMLEQHGVTTLLRFPNYESIVEAARQRRVNVFVIDAPPALYYLNKSGIANEFRRSALLNVGEFHRAVRKGDSEMLATVEAGFAMITAEELRAIDEKWMGRSLGDWPEWRYVGYAAVAVALAISGLVGWNRALRRQVDRRTAALRESEARFRKVVENIQEVFWMSDVADRRIIYVSPNYERIWGRTCASLYADPRSWIESVHAEDAERVRLAYGAKQPDQPYDETYRVVRPDGVIRWVRDRGFYVEQGPDGSPCFVGLAEDITDRRALEERFLRSQRMEAIGMLSGGIAHDLNNILAPILLSTGFLRNTVKDEHDRELLKMLEKNTQRGANLIRQLLIFSRGTTGQRAAVAIAALFAEIATIVRTTFPRNLELQIDAAPGLPAIWADSTQVHQVLLNLCVNARDAMPGGGTLTVNAVRRTLDETASAVHAEAKPGDYVVITVTDTGEGIPPGVIDRIFEPFFTTKSVGRGSGLGLSTVLGIVKSHDGFVNVRSTPGRGTTFEVFLPAAAPTAAATAPPFGEDGPRGEGDGVLVVDDEPAVLDATQEGLERAGYTVLVAAGGEEALRLFKENQIDVRLVLTDVMMPVMNGVALVRALREVDPTLPVIATTGLSSDREIAELAELGVTDVVMKPCELRDLLAVIRRVLAEKAGRS